MPTVKRLFKKKHMVRLLLPVIRSILEAIGATVFGSKRTFDLERRIETELENRSLLKN